MKRVYMINGTKADGSPLTKGVEATDGATPAIVQAINAWLTAAGSGATVLSVSQSATVDISV